MIISRTARDFTDIQESEYLKKDGLHLKEELTTGDNEAQSRLWPGVEKAGQMRKKAYFSEAFPDGKELKT